MAMVIAFGVMFSTFLSGPVAMVATFACVLLGFSAEQVYDTRHFIDTGIGAGWWTDRIDGSVAQAGCHDHPIGRRYRGSENH